MISVPYSPLCPVPSSARCEQGGRECGILAVDDGQPPLRHAFELTTPLLLVVRQCSQLGRSQGGVILAPFRDLILTAGRILVERDVVVRDQVIATLLDEPGNVLGKMLARLRHEIAEASEDVEADPFPGQLSSLIGQLS